MVLVQFPLTGYNVDTGRINARVPCNLNGRYKVRFLNYVLNWTVSMATSELLMLVDSRELLGNFPGGQLVISSASNRLATINSNYCDFEVDKLTGIINIDVCLLDGTVPASFRNGLLNFDFEKINEN